MRGHDTQLQRILWLSLVMIALRKNGPSRPCTRFNPNDFLHDANSLWDIVIDIRLVSLSYQGFDLRGQRQPFLSAWLQESSLYAYAYQ
jgi:hypothetical protein